MTELYFPKNKWLANQIYSHFYKLVTVSKAIKNKVLEEYTYRQAETIYNPIDIDTIEKQSLEKIEESGNFILAVGRMTDRIKQFDVLIRSYAASHLPEKNIKLIILGDGPVQLELKGLAQSLELQDKILFKGMKSNPFPYFKHALFTVLTSKNECFPRVEPQ
jgi:N-acetylgalactosamine-N,N'-diacetylbacillosaminyl-diphospho-undecaprenol 4-alpha-N-acetylgalactosaminyltransferase